MKKKIFTTTAFFVILFFVYTVTLWAAVARQPITVNGDTVEYKTEGGEMVAQGNVEIIQLDSKLTCDKVRVFMDAKIAIAEGHVKFLKTDGQELHGDMIVYDFDEQTGTIVRPQIKMVPYYGKAQVMEKISDSEFLMNGSEISTCDLPHPHYKLTCDEVHMYPGRLMTAKGVKFSLFDFPFFYLPSYSQRLTDKRPRFMITPGYRKFYGAELLGAYRYYLNDNAKGILHLDWYSKKGFAEGVDLNYDTKSIGAGNIKYYHIHEIDTNTTIPEGERQNQERYRVEVRHQWQATSSDHVVLEFFRQSDLNFLHDYFYREYEAQADPQSFLLWSHVFPNATFSFLGQPRVNEFDTVLQKIPELKLETINQKIGQTPFYYKSTSTMSRLSSATANVGPTADVFRIDTSNQISRLFQWMGIAFRPYVGYQDTYYSRGVDAKDSFLRNMFFTGMDMSTKLYKTYDVSTNALHLNINQLRHIMTSSVQYRYQADPSVGTSRIQQLDTIDSLDRTHLLTLNFENKLQTKRDGVAVDLANLIVSTDYNIDRNETQSPGFQDIRYKLEFKPYSSWEFDSDAEFDTTQGCFKTLHTNFWLNWDKKTSLNFGSSSGKGVGNQLTMGISHQLNPFWKVDVYERFELRTGSLGEQDFTLTRDLHCWLMSFVIEQREGEGTTFMLTFTLKAFPGMGVHSSASFSPPRTKTQ